MQYKLKKNRAIRQSIAFFQKSYCTSECSTNLKKSCYTLEYSILSNNRTVRPSGVQIQKKSRAIRLSIAFFQNIVLYVRVQYKFKKKSCYTSEYNILSKNHTIRPSAVQIFKNCAIRSSILFFQKIVLYVRVQYKFKKIMLYVRV